MKRLHTHYDNLKVTRDAPPEVIRAAYQALSRKYHPDLNQGNPSAERAMALINAAYEALSDPRRKRDHDQWIARVEAEVEAERLRAPRGGPGAWSRADPASQPRRALRPAVAWGGVLTLVAALVGGTSWWLRLNPPPALAARDSLAESPPPPSSPTPAPASGYVRPPRAPSGDPWPTASGYVPGFKRLFDDGPGVVQIDNSDNGSDVYIKLYTERDARAFAVRWIFVRGHDAFVVTGLRAGRYEVRYRELDTGNATKTSPFEVAAPAGPASKPVRITVRLTKPPPHGLADADF